MESPAPNAFLMLLILFLSEQDWRSMELPFTNLEIAFILIAFFVFSLFTLASVYSQPNSKREEESPHDECFKTKSTGKTKQKAVPGVSAVKEVT
ncbi:hypothetical protein SKAU_G00343750 [Synaphobranchus kaupii]|uniref:Small integral membrane protein 31 n=1 Tax=Synaphobranchus kaupii TaxID=118154 RepID=A0A9Q1EJ51_SYNKA|nr:hypothetical protein SKAU_G00343750 [Synaphobranchus kaupii]